MKRQIILRPEAEAELAEAFRWYEERMSGLGREFLSVARQPEQYAIIHHNVRRALVRKFPYMILFLDCAEQIVVLAVFHAKRIPHRWQKRH
jgi:plasmid stabilization system protein ParE